MNQIGGALTAWASLTSDYHPSKASIPVSSPTLKRWRADIRIRRTLYAEAPEGACKFPNSENATLVNSQWFHRPRL